MSADRLNELRDAGYTGLDMSPGDPLAHWAHGEIVRLRAELAINDELTLALRDAEHMSAVLRKGIINMSDTIEKLCADLSGMTQLRDNALADLKLQEEATRDSNTRNRMLSDAVRDMSLRNEQLRAYLTAATARAENAERERDELRKDKELRKNEPSPGQAPGYHRKGLCPNDSGRHPSSQQAAWD